MPMNADFQLPENFENWPANVRDEWVREVHALYFPWKHLRIPATLRTRIEAKVQVLGLDVVDGVILALEEWIQQ